MSLDEKYKKVALELNLPVKLVKEVYQSYWKGVREYLSSVPLKDNITEEDFSKLRPNVNIPSLGKFFVNWERLKNKKEDYERYSNKRV